jgi:hypothetical protein
MVGKLNYKDLFLYVIMGALFNISSIFILLPLVVITNVYEMACVISIAIVSSLYHSNREIDAKNETDLIFIYCQTL